MSNRWPNYDPSLEALLRPEKAHPEGLHAAGDGWPVEAVCAEFSRMAYMRFESDSGMAQLKAALTKARFGEPVPFLSEALDRKRSGNSLVRWFRDHDAQAFAATSLDGALTILAFRGTQADRPRDLLADLSAWPVKWGGAGKVHSGFWKAYSSLEGQIRAWLGQERGKRLLVTGHSLGAAMAVLMAAVHREGELVTFGCPLVGNRAFAAAWDRPAIRYVDCSDIVTTVPFSWLGFEQVGELRYIDRHGRVASPPPGEPEMLSDRREGRRAYVREFLRPGNAPSRRFADHAPVNYVSAVAGLREDP